METQQEYHTLSSIQIRFVNTAQYTISYQKQIFFKILILYLHVLLTFGVLFYPDFCPLFWGKHYFLNIHYLNSD